MFIAAGSDFSGSKVWGEKREAEMQTAAQTGGGGNIYFNFGLSFDNSIDESNFSTTFITDLLFHAFPLSSGMIQRQVDL